jgi:hypothetical protein
MPLMAGKQSCGPLTYLNLALIFFLPESSGARRHGTTEIRRHEISRQRGVLKRKEDEVVKNSRSDKKGREA